MVKKPNTMVRMIIACFLMTGHPVSALSQNLENLDSDSIDFRKDNDWSTLIEDISENSENEIHAERWQEILSELAENPITLNTATKETLESIPFLSEDQVEALSYYIYRYGPLVSLSELLLVEGMDEQTLRWMKPFVCLGKPTLFPIERPSIKKAFKYGKQELRARFARSLQEKAGYANAADSSLSDKTYLGNPYQIYFRYGFNYKEKMQWGIVLEKDAGEKIWNKGIDYLSLHFAIKDQKRIKTLIIGDYNLRFGQGLVCASAFSLGKSVNGTSLEQIGTNLSRHFSSSESGFFRGIGATFILKPFVRQTSETKGKFGLEMTAFGSFRNLDAKISNGSFTTISTGELHRTTGEYEIKNQLTLSTMGTHLSFRTDKSQLGFSALTYGFNAKCNPEWKPYNCFYFRGKQGGNLSLDYRLRFKGILFFGEYAMDEKKKTALLSGLSIKPNSSFDLSLLGRNYALAYNAFYGNSFSEGSSVQNEYGLFVSGEWRIIKYWRFNAYYDLFVFPWLKYGINAPSNGTDYALQATWVPSPGSQILLRFKSKSKDKNRNENENTFSPVEKQLKNQIRFQVSSTHEDWVLKTVLDGNSLETLSEKSKTMGFSVSQEASYSPVNKPVSFSIRYAIFDTDQFDNRIYSYEKDLPGVFAMTPFNGQGSRINLLFKYKFSKAISIQIKVGHSAYRDRQQVGTALEQVQGNQLTDIRSLFLWKF